MSTPAPPTPAEGLPVGTPRRRGPSPVLVVVALLLAVVLGLATGFVLSQDGGGGPDADAGDDEPTAAAVSAIEPASVESFDPVGGSGLIPEGDGTWRTQTYTTAAFGALKPGVGLVLDLGEPHHVESVTLPSSSEGLTVELRAGGETPVDSPAALEVVDTATTQAEGTELSGADAGEHRYWMVWITGLAPRGEGFGADLTTPVVRGR